MVRAAYGTRPSGEVQPLQWAILRYLNAAPRNRRTMSFISRHLEMTHAPVGRAIHTLVNRKLVRQIDHPQDARSKIVLLTPSGVEMLKNDPLLNLAERFDVLSPQEQSDFRATLQAIAQRSVSD